MAKKENANISMPDSLSKPRSEPNVPPGFPPNPSNSAAAESSRNRSPTCTEKEFRRRLHKYFYEFEPPRRTSRKRSRPQFYTPPVTPQTPRCRGRGRGRPSKARSMSQLSDEQGSHLNTSSSLHHLTRMKGNTCDNIAVDKNQERTTQESTSHNHDVEETVFNISLNGAPTSTSPRSCYGNNTSSPGIDPKILQHVANALKYMAGSQSRSSPDIDKNLLNMLKTINKKHGDITRDCSLESDCMKTLVLFGICKVVQDLQNKQLKDLDFTTLDSCYTAVKDAENMKMNVQWLRNRLDEIKDAIKLAGEAKVLVNEKNRRLEIIDRKKDDLLLHKVELERLKSEIQEIEDQVSQEVVMVQVLNERISAQTSKISKFQHMYLMDGLM